MDKQLNNNHEVSETDIVGGSGGDVDDINDNIRLSEKDQNFNIEKSSTTSGSSVEPRSDCSYPEIEQILNVRILYNKHHKSNIQNHKISLF